MSIIYGKRNKSPDLTAGASLDLERVTVLLSFAFLSKNIPNIIAPAQNRGLIFYVNLLISFSYSLKLSNTHFTV